MQSSWAQFGVMFTALVTVMGLIFGDTRLRQGVLANGIAGALVVVTQLYAPLYQPQLFLVYDLALFLVFLALCWKSDVAWPYWVAVLQMLSLAIDLRPLLDDRFLPWASLRLLSFAGYVILLVFVLAIVPRMFSRRKLTH